MAHSSEEYKKLPTAFIIFGATGDLARKKLFPALFDLYTKGLLPDTCKIIGFAKSQRDNEAFRAIIREAIEQNGHTHSAEDIDAFTAHAHYHAGLFEQIDDYENLSQHIEDIDASFGWCASKLFYMATPPSAYATILQNLSDSGLTIPCGLPARCAQAGGEKGWTRVLLEKPIGTDIHTEKELDELLSSLFAEEQVFRIDHYLGKETLENILMFRFSNRIFAPLWNTNGIEKIEIYMHEDIDVSDRGSFYDTIGALRDVGQNHMMQMLAAVTMENPGALAADAIREKRAKALEALHCFSADEAKKQTKRGQYAGYTDTENVDAHSHTETYFHIETHLEDGALAKVPIFLEAGKRMRETRVEIKIHFTDAGGCVCPPDGAHTHQNVLTFTLKPEKGIAVRFWAKQPGFSYDLEPQDLSFSYVQAGMGEDIPDAHERLLYAALLGDQTLFASTREVRAGWAFVTPILEAWENGDPALTTYDDAFPGVGS